MFLRSFSAIVFVALAFLVGCTKEQKWEPILLSKDVCHYCKMVISDKRFGAEFVTEKGKVFKFDAIECLGHYHEDNAGLKGTAYVVDSFSESNMIPLKTAQFFHDPNVRSPMGKGIFAGPSAQALESHNPQKHSVIDWQGVLKLIGRPELINLL